MGGRLLGRRRLLLAGVLVLVAVAAAWFVVRPRLAPTPLEEAVGVLPAGTLRAAYTDWEAAADEAGGTRLDASSSPRQIGAFLNRGFDANVTGLSALEDSFAGFGANFGFLPTEARWEVYGQSREGAVDVLRLPDDVAVDDLEDRFAEMGYAEPSGGRGEGGVWRGSAELVVGLDEPLTDTQQNVAVVGSEHLLLTADDPDYLAQAVDVVQGGADPLSSVEHVADLVEVLGSPTVAEVWSRDFACEDLAMSQADPAEASEGDDLVAEAGGVHPLAGMVVGQGADQALTVGFAYEDEDQADDDLQPRVDLASGPAPGQGGSFADRFRVSDGTASDGVVTLRLTPVDGPVLTDVFNGPLLFATC